jgi:tyrosyl-tRNA synthetase
LNTQGAKLNEAKVLLADECTRMLHGEEYLKGIHETVNTLFGDGGADLASLPTYNIPETMVGNGVGILDLFVLSELASSKSEARRLVRGGGAKLNGKKLDDEGMLVSPQEFMEAGGKLQLSAGKKKHALIELQKTEANS